ncbi:MAG: Sua5/YciO/YrdC/YwlC family protein, partial [Pseudomonadota bacterium]|nr:Sua5/YciO/YrdC/YwlC family protein [Pseudomonadota bacterium]
MAVLAAIHANITRCAERLRAGGIVAMPTETVYGLAADATNAAAVTSVYASKNRPKINPLICHVGAPEEAFELGVFNAHARRLAERFWPG